MKTVRPERAHGSQQEENGAGLGWTRASEEQPGDQDGSGQRKGVSQGGEVEPGI